MRKMIMLAAAGALVVLPGAAAVADPATPPMVAGADATVLHRARGMLAEAAGLPAPPVSATDVSDNIRLGATLASGGRHTCATALYSTVWCWGANDSGQLGDGGTASTGRPVRSLTPELAMVAQLVAGDAHTCALIVEEDSGDVYCWGDDGEGQIGDGGSGPVTEPEQVANDAIDVAAGAQHTCVAAADGTVSCWGRNDVGQLGIGVTGGSESTPQPVPGLTDIVDVAADDNDTCAVDQDGHAWCWGSDTHGQLGDGGGGSGTPSSSPVAVTAVPDGFASIDVGYRHACALVQDAADTYCWGDDTTGQLSSAPTAVSGGPNFLSISAGGDTTCGTTEAARAYCWGSGADGRLGTGDDSDRPGPTPVDDDRMLTSPLVKLVSGVNRPLVVEAAAGPDHSCFGDFDGNVYCAGAGTGGQLGTGSTAAVDVPVRVPLGPGPARQVRASARDEGLTVSWRPPASSGAAPVSVYVAFALTDQFTDLTGCVALQETSCVISDLTNDRRYTVVVGAASAAGTSYSGLTSGTPRAAGAGLPITGPGLTTAWLLLGTGAALILISRRPGRS